METFNLESIKKYELCDADFLKTSIFLFKNEITSVVDLFSSFDTEKKFLSYKQKIHKIKPSCELFNVPKHIINLINDLNHIDVEFYETEVVKNKLMELLEFFKLLQANLGEFILEVNEDV